jgi:hypothetical protein
MRDNKSNHKAVQSLAVTARTSTATGTAVDRAGFESATFLFHVYSWTNGTHTFGAEHSDNGTDYTAVPTADLIGTAVVEANDDSPAAADLAGKTTLIGYIGGKRYIKPKATVTGSPANGAVYGVDVLLGHPHVAPVS